MADILTQVQDCLDQLLNQMHATLYYTNTSCPPSAIEGQPSLGTSITQQTQDLTQNSSTQRASEAAANTQTTDPSLPEIPHPAPPEEFIRTLHELSRDLVLKEQQIELLISRLPGIGISEKEQIARMQGLERELEAIEEEREEAVREKEELVKVLEGKILGVGALGW
ncbi:CSE2-domain-containing protein [Delitschia confertaspora ATCC 74209]|uniref:Mediator of RNA polymerase II transcription subunit 21 n=1 Tax=Delitschia confertaspora ATCC 74209 TaxID=1513339 RepID=A0A9P4JHC1_9PLEO|nr:CSE2-domain-containing protein [Delitschia confertaspora ATCC 74209]